MQEEEEEGKQGEWREAAEIDVKETLDGRETLETLDCRLRDWITSTK